MPQKGVSPACRQAGMKRNCNFGGETKIERIVVI
jgi:hypothetical protein